MRAPDGRTEGNNARYIAVEGIDGAGKTSATNQLTSLLESRGQQVVRVREPGGTLVGEEIRQLLLSGPAMGPWTEALMFAAARAQLVDEVVRPALASGAWVLSDRSVYSSLAYQGVGRGLGIEQVKKVNEAGLGGTWPGRVLFLSLPVDVGLSRQKRRDRISSQGESLLSSVADGFERLAAEEPGRFVVLDATAPTRVVVKSAARALGVMP